MVTPKEKEFLSRIMKKCSRIDCDDGCTTLNILKLVNYTLLNG